MVGFSVQSFELRFHSSELMVFEASGCSKFCSRGFTLPLFTRNQSLFVCRKKKACGALKLSKFSRVTRSKLAAGRVSCGESRRDSGTRRLSGKFFTWVVYTDGWSTKTSRLKHSMSLEPQMLDSWSNVESF